VHLDINKVFYLPTDALFISVLEIFKIYIKTYIQSYIKISSTCFGLRPSSGSLHMSLAKVTLIKSVKVRRYGLCGCVAACYIKWNSAQHTAHPPPWTWYNMLPHNHIVHNDVLLPILRGLEL